MPVGKKVVFAAVLAGSGVAAAQNGTPQTKTFVSPTAPVISPGSPAVTNPAVNPSAAGLSQGGTAGPAPSVSAGHNNPPGIGRGDMTASQARASLRNYGYTDITNLHLNQGHQWQAQATHNGRRVKVVLGDRGTATVQK